MSVAAAGAIAPAAPVPPRPGAPLTAREIEVLARITAGASTAEVASGLYISTRTVKNHLASIYQKLDVPDRTQAVLRALRLGFVSLDG